MSLTAFSLEKTVKSKNYEMRIFYPKELQPGDALFVRVQLNSTDKGIYKNSSDSSGSLRITSPSSEKPLGKSDFYIIDISHDKTTKSNSILAGIPLSSYFKTGTYTASLSLKPFGLEEITQSVDFNVIPKEFVSETIPLNATNTAIKTDSSKTRSTQIDTLNTILKTVDPNATYERESFIQPTPATRRTSFFADRRIYAYSNGKQSVGLHYGIDFGIPTGSEVRACGKGKVVLAANRISTGWSVVIEHLPGLYSLYYHNSELKVKEGDFVQKGDLIAISGATGLATGPHLHWEIRLNMEAVSPDFFTGDFTFEKEAQSYSEN